MSHTINGETVYTKEEVDNEVFATRHNQHEKSVGIINTITLDVLRDKVTNEVVTEAQGLEIYNAIGEKVGSTSWPTLDTLIRTWTVTVSYLYENVLEVTDVKADTEEDAIAEVEDNLSIHNARLTFDIEYDGEGRTSDSVEVDYDDGDIINNLEFSAEEQD